MLLTGCHSYYVLQKHIICYRLHEVVRKQVYNLLQIISTKRLREVTETVFFIWYGSILVQYNQHNKYTTMTVEGINLLGQFE